MCTCVSAASHCKNGPPGLKEPEETKSEFESDGDVNYTDGRRLKGCILMADKILKEGKIIFFT